ncbi:MAG: hypothetical protein NT118_17335, partial [Lentisphaerae bacterium]|nr:hypothetical protein [Lentisphaerota bacterium]
FANYVRTPDKNIYLKNIQCFGVGSLGFQDKGIPSKKDLELLKTYGISQELCLFASRPANYLFFTPEGVPYQKVHIMDGDKELVEWDGRITTVSPEFEKQIEEATETVARNNPWVSSWALWGELDNQCPNLSFDDIAKLLRATYRGAKKGNPNARVYLDQGAMNMSPSGGIKYLREMIRAVGKTPKFDDLAIHPYRTTPERPDLDEDTVVLLEMLQENGYGDTDVYWNEGIYYAAYNIPAWGLYSNYGGASAEHWVLPPPSYDMGWGEKIAAAYTMRSYLVALKYQTRIKTATCWSLNDTRFNYMDAYNTPFALIRTINTLGNLLGNAEFKEDIRFARNSRAYVFKTPEKQPVVAVWSYIPEVDRGNVQEPVFEINLANCNVDFFDMMGAKREIQRSKDRSYCVPLSPFPVFIRGAGGSTQAICKALKNVTVKGEAMGAPFKVWALLSDTNTITLNFQNMYSRVWNGTANIDGETSVLSIPPLATEKRQIRLKQEVAADHITEIKLPVSLKENNGQVFGEDIALPAFRAGKAKTPIRVDGDLSDWQGIPAINATNRLASNKSNENVGYPGDHEAWFKVAWDENNLYLCSKVIDDKFSVNEKLDINAQWQNDCMQVYFDTFCDARANYSVSGVTGLDKDDYSFDFFPCLNGEKLVAYRRTMPEAQLCGGTLALREKVIEPGIKTAFKRTADGYIYEIAFPKSYIEPLNLAPGTNIGLGLMWSDRDEGELKSHLSIIPGKGCYNNVHLLPIMILADTEK